MRRDHARETTGDTADPVGDAGEESESIMALREALEAEADLREAIHQAMARPDFDGGFPYDQGFFELPGETSVLLMAGKWLQAEAYLATPPDSGHQPGPARGGIGVGRCDG